jgi:hypothetical protein
MNKLEQIVKGDSDVDEEAKKGGHSKKNKRYKNKTKLDLE